MLEPLALYDPLEHMSNWLVRLDGAGPTQLRLVFSSPVTKTEVEGTFRPGERHCGNDIVSLKCQRPPAKARGLVSGLRRTSGDAMPLWLPRPTLQGVRTTRPCSPSLAER